MNAIEYIKTSMLGTKSMADAFLNDLKEAPLAQAGPEGGNHALWIAGHYAYSESTLFDQFVLGKPNRFAEWKMLFSRGSSPMPDASAYPPLDELIAAYDAVRADSLGHLDTMTDSDLDQRSHAPDEAGLPFIIVGGCYSAMTVHAMFHAGQMADIRRALGKGILIR